MLFKEDNLQPAPASGRNGCQAINAQIDHETIGWRVAARSASTSTRQLHVPDAFLVLGFTFWAASSDTATAGGPGCSGGHGLQTSGRGLNKFGLGDGSNWMNSSAGLSKWY